MPAHTISSAEQHDRMLLTPIPKLISSLAVPTVTSQLISVFYNTADTYFVSKLSTSASAAVGVVFSLMSIIQAFGYGLSMGAGSLISVSLGGNDTKRANYIGSSAFFAAIAVGLFLLTGGLASLTPLMRLLGSTETILPYSVSYARIILLAAPVMCASFILSSILRAEGEASLSMWGLCTGGLLNVALDPLLIFVLDMGIAGAALATALSQLISFLILGFFFLRGRSIVSIHIRSVSRHPRDYFRIVLTGFPTICRQGFASLSSALLNNAAASYSDAAVAALTISNKVYLLIRSIIIGIGQGFQPVAGYNYGAGSKKRTRQAFWFSTLLGTLVCILCAAVIALFPAQIMHFFRDDAEVTRIGSQALLYACMVMPLMAYSTYVNQLYQCLGFHQAATLLASCRNGLFYVPLIWLLPRLLDLTGVQMSQPAADLLTFVVSIPFQIWFFRHKLSETAKK